MQRQMSPYTSIINTTPACAIQLSLPSGGPVYTCLVLCTEGLLAPCESTILSAKTGSACLHGLSDHMNDHMNDHMTLT